MSTDVCPAKGADVGAGRSIHRQLPRCFMLLGSFVLATSTTAIADKDYPTSIINNSESPVTLTKCEAWARDINKTVLYSHASVPNMLSDVGISFMNNSNKTITALRLEASTYDMTNAALPMSPRVLDSETNRSADKMSVAPGTSFDLLGPRSWHPGYNIFENADHITCAVTVVKFADGTIWTATSDNQAGDKSAPASGSTGTTNKRYPTSILSYAQSPVRLTTCELATLNLNKATAIRLLPNDPRVASIGNESLPNWLVELGIAFSNGSTKAITALRVDAVSYDSFNGLLVKRSFDTGEDPAAKGMSVPPGSSFDLLGPRGWLARNGYPNRDHVTCAVSAVRFADGAVWTAPPSATPVP